MAELGLPLADIAPVLGRSNDCVEVHARAQGIRVARRADPDARTIAQARWLSMEAAHGRARSIELRARLAEATADCACLHSQARALVATSQRLIDGHHTKPSVLGGVR
jgi:hypothetical protein